jgi:hypothetical protein
MIHAATTIYSGSKKTNPYHRDVGVQGFRISFIFRYIADISVIHSALTTNPGLKKSSSYHCDAGIKGLRMSSISRHTVCI